MTLYQECLQALKDYKELSKDESEKILDRITNEIEFTWYERIDFSKIKNKKVINNIEELDELMEKEVYVFWDVEKHIIKTKLENIINAWDDVEALGTRTWVVSNEMDFFLEYYDEMWLGFNSE